MVERIERVGPVNGDLEGLAASLVLDGDDTSFVCEFHNDLTSTPSPVR